MVKRMALLAMVGVGVLAGPAHAQTSPSGFATPPAQVLGAEQTRDPAVAAAALPRTGASHTEEYVGVGLASVAGGGLLVVLARKRRTASAG